MNLPEWQNVWQFLQNNWEFLTGTGAAFGGAGAWIWKYRTNRRRQITAKTNTFPFEAIRPYSNDVLPRLVSEYRSEVRDHNEPLADFNIPYQIRRSDRNIRRELEDSLEETGRLLIMGSTGLGKTREAAELAKVLNNEGWTVLKYQEGEWLDVPSSFPPEVCSRRKLLFCIDNFHRITYRGRTREFSPEAENPASPLKIPFQERLLQFLQYFEDECDPEQIRVIAITRNEPFPDKPGIPSNLEKLEIDKFPKLWDSFRQYELPEPDEKAIVQLLEAVIPMAGIQSNPTDYPLIAQRNDNTFNNIIENIKTIRGRQWILSTDTFLETQKRSWYGRYRRIVKQYPLAKCIYYSGNEIDPRNNA